MPKLTYVVDGGETRSVEIGDSCSIGNLAGNTIVLDASLGVSRRHCQILKIQNGYEVADLGSTNGTKVNGTAVKKQKLVNGDRIEVGKAVLTFDDGSGPAVEEEISLEEPAGAGAPAAAASKSASTGGAASDQCMLVFAGGDKDGQKIPLEKQRVTFGRNAKNTVVLSDTGASGFHAEIAREGGAYVLRDLGSTNGTLVDGEPISETALQHGARIRMGGTRFVFVDPTVSDFEKAMAAVDDLGSEWGLLRAEMDMTRVQEARRSQMIMIVLVLVVVLGGGAFVMTHPDLFTGAKQQIARIEGNKVPDPSFEDHPGDGWAARPSTPTKARAADAKSDGNAHQGTSFYAVSRDGPAGTCAAAQSSLANAFIVSPGKPVEFGAFVKATGGAMCGVRLVWIDRPDKDGKEIGRNATTLSSSGDWQEVRSAAMPPEGARAARIELLDAAGGTAYFDDVFLLVGSGNAGGGKLQDQEVAIVSTGDGQSTITRNDARLLVRGAVVGGALRGDAIADPTVRGDRVGSQVVSAGASSTASGQFVDPATGQLSPFNIGLAPKGGRLVEIKGTLTGGEAAWVATLPDEFVAAGVGVRTETDFRRAGEPRLFDKVQDVSFGGTHRFKVSRAEGCGPLRVALYKTADGWEVGFGATDGKLSIVVDTDSQALQADIEKLKSEASQAKSQHRLGIAVSKLKQLGGFHPQGSAEAMEVERDSQQIEAQGRATLERLDKRVAGAIQFRDEDDLVAAAREADTLQKEFAEHEVGLAASKLGAAVKEALDKLHGVTAERLAAPLLRKADDFLAHKMPNLAKAFYDEIVQRYPGTEAEKKAREQLAKL